MVVQHPIKKHFDMHIITDLIKKNVVLTVAFIAALFTSFIVPPDARYFSYLDYRTLTCLFCTLAVIFALRNIKFFSVVARKLVSLTGSTRRTVIALLVITFVGSMLIANDMALITFLPLGYIALKETEQEKYITFTFVMQNIAANLGGMLTPFGNPQNLFLYNKFLIPTGEFTLIMLPPFLLSISMIIASCFLFVKNERISLSKENSSSLPFGKTLLYLLLFAFSLVIVFRIVPYYLGLVIIPLILLIADRKALKDVDYGLLLTFACFFVFAGNMSRIDIVSRLFSALLEKNTLVFSALSCQFISNVPSAILLSEFTTNYKDLLIGVNIGGAGTLIASLASLITFSHYQKLYPQSTKKYLIVFSAISFTFLAVLTLFCLFV